MSSVYVETSALLRALLDGDLTMAEELRSVADRSVTSTLTLLEANRSISRALALKQMSAQTERAARMRVKEFGARCDLMELAPSVLERAGQMFRAEPLRTLDAVHLATALLWAERMGDVVILSCDRRIRENAAAYGLPVAPASL